MCATFISGGKWYIRSNRYLNFLQIMNYSILVETQLIPLFPVLTALIIPNNHHNPITNYNYLQGRF